MCIVDLLKKFYRIREDIWWVILERRTSMNLLYGIQKHYVLQSIKTGSLILDVKEALSSGKLNYVGLRSMLCRLHRVLAKT